jgi:hypothetical protein
MLGPHLVVYASGPQVPFNTASTIDHQDAVVKFVKMPEFQLIWCVVLSGICTVPHTNVMQSVRSSLISWKHISPQLQQNIEIVMNTGSLRQMTKLKSVLLAQGKVVDIQGLDRPWIYHCRDIAFDLLGWLSLHRKGP